MRAWKETKENNVAEYAARVRQYVFQRELFALRHRREIRSGILLEDLDLLPVPPSRVSYSESGISLHVHPNGVFDIHPWSRIDTPLKLLRWVREVSGKTWADRRMIRDLVELVTERYPRRFGEKRSGCL